MPHLLEIKVMRYTPLVGLALAALALVPAACAQHGHPPIANAEAPAQAQAKQQAQPPAQAAGQTQSLQGGDNSAWTDNPNMHAFYDLTVATLGKGAKDVDFDAYRDKSYAIFRAFGASMGASPDAMVDHLKDIPRQLVGIVKDDPKVLESYKSFTLALMGPP